MVAGLRRGAEVARDWAAYCRERAASGRANRYTMDVQAKALDALARALDSEADGELTDPAIVVVWDGGDATGD